MVCYIALSQSALNIDCAPSDSDSIIHWPAARPTACLTVRPSPVNPTCVSYSALGPAATALLPAARPWLMASRRCLWTLSHRGWPRSEWCVCIRWHNQSIGQHRRSSYQWRIQDFGKGSSRGLGVWGLESGLREKFIFARNCAFWWIFMVFFF